MKKRIRWTEFVLIALGLCLTLGVKLVFHACAPMEDGTWMHCHTAENAIMGIGVGITALAVLRLFVKPQMERLLDLVTAAAAIVAALVPGRIVSLCMHADARCQLIMKPATLVVCVLIAVACAVDALLPRKAR